jgi:tRNA U34 5-methylaminomethyl-2-thiouridine-forming methyltransferase MnmC
MSDPIKVIETDDGSKTLYDADRDVHYRTKHGARTESNFVFVHGSGLLQKPAPWQVLELGFGAGVNFVQTALACFQHYDHKQDQIQLEYHAVDCAPVAPALLEFHPGELGAMARQALSEAGDGHDVIEVSGFGGRIVLKLYPRQWLDFDQPELSADALYFDPFGPRTEPGSWTTECFEVAARHMSDTAILATYSAATHVKRAMFEAGLWAATADGPGRKREITFAAKTRATLDARQGVELLSRDKYLARNQNVARNKHPGHDDA